MSEAGDCCVVPKAEEELEPTVDQNGNKMEDKVSDDKYSGEKMAAKGSEVMPPLEIANLVDADSRSSTPSEGFTPRDCETSSGSPSPVPEDGSDTPQKKINLGRDISLMMQALNSLHSPEEKIAALCKKYADLLEQQKLRDKKLRGMERKSAQAAKEKDLLQKDLNKALLGKSKMESLARELNKQNKLLKEETYNLTLSHNKEREQVSAKFQAATDEISGKINAIADRNELLNEQNREMSEKIAKLVEETVSREKMVKTMMEQRDLQERILELKVKKAEEERDLTLKEHEELKKELKKTTALCESYMKQEKELKTQIAYYSDKVSDFQSTLDKSNKVFTTFRQEMDNMNTKMKELEKATATWKKNYEKVESENQRLMTETMEQARQINQLNIKVTRLTNLSRALQAERNDLAKKAKATQKKSDTVTAEATSTVSESKTQNGILQPLRPAPSQPSSEVRGQPQGQESQISSTQEESSTNEAQNEPTSSENDAPSPRTLSTPTSDTQSASTGDNEASNFSTPVEAEADSTSDVSPQSPPSNEVSSTAGEEAQE